MLLYNYAPILTENNVNMEDSVDLVKSDFGDGYSYSAPRGLNHIRMNASVQWTNLTKVQKDLLISFFKERGGYKNFNWKPPSIDSGVFYWKCEEWDAVILAPGYYNVSAKFVQDFALGEDE